MLLILLLCLLGIDKSDAGKAGVLFVQTSKKIKTRQHTHIKQLQLPNSHIGRDTQYRDTRLPTIPTTTSKQIAHQKVFQSSLISSCRLSGAFLRAFLRDTPLLFSPFTQPHKASSLRGDTSQEYRHLRFSSASFQAQSWAYEVTSM